MGTKVLRRREIKQTLQMGKKYLLKGELRRAIEFGLFRFYQNGEARGQIRVQGKHNTPIRKRRDRKLRACTKKEEGP